MSKVLSGTRILGSAKTCRGVEAEDGGDSGKLTGGIYHHGDAGAKARESNADPTCGTHEDRDAKSASARTVQRSTRVERACVGGIVQGWCSSGNQWPSSFHASSLLSVSRAYSVLQELASWRARSELTSPLARVIKREVYLGVNASVFCGMQGQEETTLGSMVGVWSRNEVKRVNRLKDWLGRFDSWELLDLAKNSMGHSGQPKIHPRNPTQGIFSGLFRVGLVVACGSGPVLHIPRSLATSDKSTNNWIPSLDTRVRQILVTGLKIYEFFRMGHRSPSDVQILKTVTKTL
ncbi:hypothetical protein DFH08DRAFT_796895 [Mycena albidolilacea]|uniref:Uncharacterized protein n=1 Tax=Mycena albidolilacea TaxID=1033008 RepID=A0AAD7F718_9AGAR|nr:hypothetical protein DFH08DRAFT_796895 [Mycena albidolilacea]